MSTLVTDGTVSETVSLALQAERQQLLMSSSSDLNAMASDWLHAIEVDCDVLDEAFACVANGLAMSESELRASWASRTDEERRRWIERSACENASVRAALSALLRALDVVAQTDPVAELDGLLTWLPQRERRVFGLVVSGPAAVRSLLGFATQHPHQPVIAMIDVRLWRDTREQLDDRTRAQLEAGRLPPLRVAADRPRPDPTCAFFSRKLSVEEELARPATPTATPGVSAEARTASLLTPDGARSAAERRLYELLQGEPVTRDLFELNVRMPFTFGPAQAEVDFVCKELRLVLEVDGFYHFQRADAYRRDRRKDVLLQHQGYLVSRHLAEDVHERAGEVMRAVRELVRRRRRSFRRESLT